MAGWLVEGAVKAISPGADGLGGLVNNCQQLFHCPFYVAPGIVVPAGRSAIWTPCGNTTYRGNGSRSVGYCYSKSLFVF